MQSESNTQAGAQMLLHTKHFTLLVPPLFHSTLMVVSHQPSADPYAVHQSFDLSQGSLPPAKDGGSEYEPFVPPKGLQLL